MKQQQNARRQRTSKAKTTAPITMPAMAPVDKPLLPLLGATPPLLVETPPVAPPVEPVPVLAGVHRAVAAQFGVVAVGIQTSPMQPACDGGNV